MEKFHQKPNVYIEQVSINVMNLDKSIAFYKEIIGFQVLSHRENKVVLTADGKTPLLTLVQPKDVQAKERRTTGLYHFALLLPTRADLAKFLRHLIQTKTEFGASDHLVSEAIYLDDPDGNGIEVYRDRPETAWNWRNDELEMATNPIDGKGLLAETDDMWNSLPKRTLMGHVHLHVSDLEQTEKFYKEGLGFNVVTHYPGALFMSSGGYHHHLGLNIWNGAGAPSPKENSVGLNWYTVVYANDDIRNEVINSLEKLGAKIAKVKDYYVTTDPSGNNIHLVI